jgi:hypothetical protein
MSHQTKPIPSQSEIDGIAHFTQAARELAASALFSEDHGTMDFAGHVNPAGEVEIEHVRLPSTKIRDSALFPFRRIWMEGEPSFYRKTLRDLKRYAPEVRHLAEHLEIELEKASRSHLDPWLARNVRLTPKEIIDLWLNTRLAHSGSTAAVGSFRREDFERHEREIGKVAFESLFVQAIQRIGGCFIAVLELTEQLLADWKQAGINPGFSFDNLDQDGTHVFADGTSITRSSPGLVIEHESPAERVLRLVKRHTFNSLSTFFEILEEPPEVIARAVIETKDLDVLLQSLGFSQRATSEHPPAAMSKHGAKKFDDDTRLIWEVVAFDTKEVFLDANARTVLNRQIARILV